MKQRLSINADLAGGVALAVVGTAASITAWQYGVGTPAHMGAGFLPFVLGLMLLAAGVAVAIRFTPSSEADEPLRLRPVFCVIGATIAFAVLTTWAGLLIGSAAVVVIASAAEPGFKLGRSLVLAAALSGIVAVLFVYLLGLPIPLLPS